eukprot:195630_1
MTESASRYGAKGANTFQDAVSDFAPDDIPQLVKRLRNVFASDVTVKKEWRIQQLKNFILMVDEGCDEFCAAMKADLHKSAFESFSTELAMVRNECEYFINHLNELMTPTYTESSALNIPAWSSTQQDPLGICLVMGAWNYPMQLSLMPMIGAIAAGNCCILKPGSYAVESSHVLAKLVQKYLDPQAIVVVEGNRDMTTALLKERFDLIFFTGSAFVGKIVAAAAAKHLTPIVLELGGKSPVIVDKSANLEHAAARIVWGAFLNCGQTCVRPDFLMMHEQIADKLLQLLKKYIIQFYGNDPQATQWFGRCINDKAFDRLSKLVSDGKKNIVIGGDTDEKDRYVSPTIFDYGSDMETFNESAIMQDEIFGPLLPSIRFKNSEQVVEFVRRLKTGKPLALYCFAKDSKFIEEIKNRTTSGGMCVNDVIMHLANDELPFGGVGASGMGGYHGKHSFNVFTHTKAVLEKSPMLDESIFFRPLLQMRFPPYTPAKIKIIKAFGTYTVSNALNLPYRILKKYSVLIAIILFMYLFGFRVRRD